MSENSDIKEAVRVLKIEAQSILDLIERLDESFLKAVDILMGCKGKVVVSGMGKSGQIARKIASTLSSTGTPSIFLSPAESLHGDLGVISELDVVVGISYGGESVEMSEILKYVVRKGIPLIALVGKPISSLAQTADAFLNINVKEEACPLGVAPTSSSTATLAMGDALAMALLKKKGFNEERFAEFHPGGSLGRRLLTKVSDVMRTGGEMPIVNEEASILDVVSLMTGKEVRGVSAVIGKTGELVGSITDGDIRRHLQKSTEPMSAISSSLMSRNPKTIDQNEMAEKAMFIMEQFQIQTLFVVDKSGSTKMKPIGILQLQDLLKAKIR